MAMTDEQVDVRGGAAGLGGGPDQGMRPRRAFGDEGGSRPVTPEGSGSVRQAVIAGAVVAGWMALGWGCRLGGDAYLLAGVPVVIAYQLGVARRPLRALWRFDGEPLAWGSLGAVAGAAAAVLPLRLLGGQVLALARGDAVDTSVAGWLLAAAAGAGGLGWGIAEARRRAAWRDRPLAALFVVVVLVGAVAPVLTALRASAPAVPQWRWFGRDLLLYSEVGWVLEEVVFRGAFDPAVASGAGLSGRRALGSAAWVSLLWGLWHLPLAVHGVSGPEILAGARVVLYHLALGVPLSMLARRAGQLGPNALAHALVDAWRNCWIAW